MRKASATSDSRSSPSRVLQIVGRMDRAGAETFLMNVYRKIDRRYIQFDFVHFTDAPCDYDEEIRALGGRIFVVRGGILSRCAALWALAQQGHWETAHSHTQFSSGLYLLFCRLAGIKKLIAHSHTTKDTRPETFRRLLYRRAMRFVISKLATDFLACGCAASTFLFGLRKDVKQIPNAVDIERFIGAKRNLDATSEKASRKLSILQVGRFADVKNHAHSLLIARELRSAGIDFELLFAGAGEGERRTRDEVERLQLDHEVQFLGLRTDMSEVMAEADVLLMPSLFEGFPVTLVESQAAGLPAVISRSISAEVDLGLQLIHFVDLEAPISDWTDRILSVGKTPPLEPIERLAALEKLGFSARRAAQRMAKVYTT